MTGYASHECEACGRRTAHTVGRALTDSGEEVDAIRCCVCGTMVAITISDKPKADGSKAK